MAMAAAAGGNQVHNVFVYGSLLADDVVRALLSRIPQSSPAILNGYHRFSIKGRVYPAILPVENKKVSGKVLHGITDPELYILDEYEDVEYERVTVDVSLMDNSNKTQALAYVWSDKNDPNLYGEWDFEAQGQISSCMIKSISLSATPKGMEKDTDGGFCQDVC
ncbi:AIG2-like protein D isoform X3 [Populus trichocarpa]|uniref:AIG2-like protein D isoform X3 n=1 Tax=Populus trichocarpa TaxID=3694 RepID=UPI000CCCF1F1|nr:AIG2-like protein D isoform X3 [Populus trichocarpa]|eukprot:XP_024460314.1 AIG2-like protein D isoform X3 [Populus trichocarpa]